MTVRAILHSWNYCLFSSVKWREKLSEINMRCCLEMKKWYCYSEEALYKTGCDISSQYQYDFGVAIWCIRMHIIASHHSNCWTFADRDTAMDLVLVRGDIKRATVTYVSYQNELRYACWVENEAIQSATEKRYKRKLIFLLWLICIKQRTRPSFHFYVATCNLCFMDCDLWMRQSILQRWRDENI